MPGPTPRTRLLPAGLDAAVAALAPSGWCPEGGPLERFHRRHHHHISLERPEGQPGLDHAVVAAPRRPSTCAGSP